ncbi:DEAD/DEAH box helicase [Curtobacterium sp. VKM Ac-2922]|uniref:DEAD/DEAH box helicase n=1 Tax=Curtobacterium sp. VKM Ac-2922 TaxID=2929475 RepID=UPI001FB4D1CD|nr:DEAD/DEAH box helicase [Curtobacterium sp. VKM Ac-2922]MCJ1715100.1 DEAD/DEAH box helicase [Curtobacterium sp. VKM Ac-2922]
MPENTLQLELHGTMVRALRGTTPWGFWLRLLNEWGADGSTPGASVEFGVERVVGHREWLRPACVQYSVRIEWDDALRAVIQSNQAQRRALGVALQTQPVLSEEAVLARLEGSRFTRQLRSFQIRDLGKVLALDHAANFSVPGAGKTTVALAAYEAERTAERVERLLVVAPISAFDAWKSGVGECFAGEKPTIAVVGTSIPDGAEILVVNYHRLDSRFDELAAWVQEKPTMVVLDEAHRMKRGWDGTFGAASLNMGFLATRRDVLTGTPAPQSPQDLVALLDFLWPGQAMRVLPQDALATPTPPDAGHLIADAVRPLFVRTKKSELDLEPPNHFVIKVEPSPLQAQIYDALRNQYAGQFNVPFNDRARFARMGRTVMYLLEAATNPRLLTAGSDEADDFQYPPLHVAPDTRLWDLIKQYNEVELPAKFEQVAALVRTNAENKRKTLIWTNFVRNMPALQRLLRRYNPAAIYGAIPSEVSDPRAEITRETELARFRDETSDCWVLLANPAAMSEGVSLHKTAHDAIYLDRTFNAGQYLQSVDRIHRLGLDEGIETNVTFLVTAGTIDEVVSDRVAEKAARLGEMLDDADIATMTLPSPEDHAAPIDVADVAALLQHVRSAP